MTAVVRTHSKVLTVFILLQCLDLLTTLVFLNKGIAEGNPIVHWALSLTGVPWVGITVTKTIAGLIGQYCYTRGRVNLLRLANIGYFLVVSWNLIGITAALVAH
jgi:hypothetical protein